VRLTASEGDFIAQRISEPEPDPYATATVSTMKLDKAIMLATAIEKLAGVLDEHLKLMEAMKLAAPRSVALQIEEKAKMLREMLE